MWFLSKAHALAAKHRRVTGPGTFVCAVCLLACSAAGQTEPLRAFVSDRAVPWKVVTSLEAMGMPDLEPAVEPGLVLEPTGLAFHTGGPGMAWSPWPIGADAFELSFDIHVERGERRDWFRAGVFVGLSTEPPLEMGKGDYAVVAAFHQSGFAATVRTDAPPMLPNLERRSPATGPYMVVRDRRHERRYKLNQGGAGGHIYSYRWGTQTLRDRTFRVLIARNHEGVYRFRLTDVTDPWRTLQVWNRTWQPTDPFDESFGYLVVGAMLDPADYPELASGEVSPDRMRGRVSRVLARQVPTPDAPPPVIEQVVAEAGSPIESGHAVIHGSGFQPGASVLVHHRTASIESTSADRIRFTWPKLPVDGPFRLSVLNPDGREAFYNRPLSAEPILSTVLPRSVTPEGGEWVRVLGSGFDRATRVGINGRRPPAWRWVDNSELQVLMPRGTPGVVALTVEPAPYDQRMIFPLVYARRPRLMVDESDLRTLQRQFAAPLWSAYRRALLARTEHALEVEPQIMPLGEAARTITPLAWSYALTRDQRYFDHLTAWLDVILDSRGIESYRFFEVGAVAMAYDLLADDLTPAMRARAEAYLHAAVADHEQQRNSYMLRQALNSQVPMNASAGIAALALGEQLDPAKKAETLAFVLERLNEWRQLMLAPDGGYPEGTVYWYSISYYLLYAHVLERVTGDDHGLLEAPKLAHVQRFMQTLMTGDGRMVSFSDTQPWLGGAAIAAGLGRRFDQPFMLALADHTVDLIGRRESQRPGRRVGPDAWLVRPEQDQSLEWDDVWPAALASADTLPYAFVWRGTSPSPKLTLPTLSTLPATHWAAMRSDGTRTPAISVQMKGKAADIAQFHNTHADLGGYSLQVHGRPVVIDPGYTPGKRAGFVAESHSVMLLNEHGPGGVSPERLRSGGIVGRDDAGVIVDAWERGTTRCVVYDVTAAYTDVASRARRLFVLAGETLIVVDDLVPKPGVDPSAASLIQLANEPSTRADDLWIIEVGGKQAILQIDGPEPSIEIEPRDFENSWVFSHMVERGWIAWSTLAVRYEADERQPLITIWQPEETGIEPARLSINRSRDQILIHLRGGRPLRLVRTEHGWQCR